MDEEIDLHLVMYLDRTLKGQDPPTPQEVQEALENDSTICPKDHVPPPVSASDSKIDQEDAGGKI